MSELEIRLAASSYKIEIEWGLLDMCGERIRRISDAERVIIISDETVWNHYGSRLEATLKSSGFIADKILIKPGEGSKNLETFAKICNQMADKNVLKDHLILALGGGVVGDIAGFAASVYMRGLSYVQIPTTLLAQVDSSVGGKTGIDLPQGKNMIGAIHQPLLVLTDPELLKTLSRKQLREGMAEIIKYGAIYDKDLFASLEEYGGIDGALLHIDHIIYRCCQIKGKFVEEDEKDKGERRKLNFGHSFGHAIERFGNFQTHSHGEAVAIGMDMAVKVGERLGATDEGVGKILSSLIKAYELPEKAEASYKDIATHMAADKKNDKRGFNLVLLKKIGESIIFAIAQDELENVLAEVLESIL
jgi:3-dehydroquinate synthase